ncbi:glycosyltransferase family 4 protein [Photobacterium phosphoreum]|uniref:glycosyltransferase family 4 protein n=1 Tax=Photobacterium phosphoreum TaxID=659 RepID=UPI001961A571|nr:glycosyltransferase family 4 protein [Photobacterium phosphoreum]
MQYLPFLEENGFNITQQSLFDDKYLEAVYSKAAVSKFHLINLFLKRLAVVLQSKKYDLIWIEYELIPYFPSWFEKLLTFLKIPYVVDYDDAIFHNYDLSNNKYIKRFFSTKIDCVMENASAVIVGNDYLFERAKSAGATNIHLVPTVVERERYNKKIENNSTIINIGWIGSPSTQKYIIDLASVFLKIASKYAIKLTLIGTTDDVIDDLSNIDVTLFPWSEAKEAEYIESFDIGIMPLKDGPWEKGKCGYKLIQYMACSVPVIASPVGCNINIIDKNNCGLLADNSDDWENTLITLIKDKQLRNEMGSAGRKAVDNQYSLQVQQIRLAEIFNAIIKDQ